MCTILCILVWVSLLENYSPTLNVSATASWSKGLKSFLGASKISNWLCYLQFMPQACLNAHQVLPLGNWRRSIMKVTNLWFTKPRGKHLLPVIWTAYKTQLFTWALPVERHLKKGGKVQEFVIPQQVLAATLPTSSPHPYVPWWDVRKVSEGVGFITHRPSSFCSLHHIMPLNHLAGRRRWRIKTGWWVVQEERQIQMKAN